MSEKVTLTIKTLNKWLTDAFWHGKNDMWESSFTGWKKERFSSLRGLNKGK